MPNAPRASVLPGTHRGRNGLLLPHKGHVRGVLDGLSAEGPRFPCDPSAPRPAQGPPARGHGGPSGV
eukprot:11481599-Alexandrium_andersonii.AAC.1